jgi:ElaB/YqjD/DUF883 family membrane-anchored ribosome-binding protein
MPTDLSEEAGDEAPAVTEAAEQGQKALKEAIAAAERTVTEAAKALERAAREAIEMLRSQTKSYTGNAGQHVDEAQRYITEKVKERPMTAAFAGLGVGLLLGLLLSNRSK